jgi:protein-tyrosine-phosphatase
MKNPIIVFVCEHGAAKSIIAAVYFNKLAKQTNSNVRAIARGTNPDSELSPQTVAGLHADGLTPSESLPQKLSPEDMEYAQQIISFCELPQEYQHKIGVEQWDDVPPVSENYELARDEIIKRMKHLFKQ